MSYVHTQGVLIADPCVQSIPIRESTDQLVYLRDEGRVRITDRHASWNPEHAIVRAGVRDRLRVAADSLPCEIQLVVEEGLRSLSVQRKLFEQYRSELVSRREHSADSLGASGEDLDLLASRYVAPPVGTPPHSTGGAIDVLLVWQNGTTIDFGSHSDEQPSGSDDRHEIASRSISDAQARNRLLLASAMMRAGFVNYWPEWWHWSYGDQYWAYVTGSPYAIYGTKTGIDIQRSTPSKSKLPE